MGLPGEDGPESSGRPVVASAKRKNCDASAKGLVGESDVQGRDSIEELSHVVVFRAVFAGDV